MNEDRVDVGALDARVFAAYADPPWLPHLVGELDAAGAPALLSALEAVDGGDNVGLNPR